MTKKEMQPKENETLHDYAERMAWSSGMTKAQTAVMHEVQKWCYIKGSNDATKILGGY